MYRVLKLKESEKLKESAFDKAQATLPLDNYHSMGIIVSEDGETVQYMYSNEDSVYESKIEYDEDGNPFFKDEDGEKWMISDFMKTNLGESENKKLTEADEEEEEIQDIKDNIEASEELEDTVDSEENQEENPVEEESILDSQLDELRDVLVDLDLNLYRIASKEDPNNVIYIIGKVAEDTNDVLMLIDTKPEELNEPEIEEPIIDDIEVDEAIDGTNAQIEDAKKDSIEKGLYSEDEEELETPEERFDFITLPKSFDEINKLNPRYGEELTPDHQAIMDYLMNCLIEVNPEAAKELADNKESEEDLPISTDDIDVGIDIDGEEDLDNED